MLRNSVVFPSVLAVLLVGCGDTKARDTSHILEDRSDAHDWTAGGVPSEAIPEVRDQQSRRAIVHLHSPWSHDACDGEPLVDGVPDADCLADLRRGLCDAEIDVAWLTDHPSHAADQDYEQRMHITEDDEVVMVDGREAAVRWRCADGTSVLIRPGYEDELMPIGMTKEMHSDPEIRSVLANSDSADAIQAMLGTGALVAVAHTEGRDPEWLARVVADGVGAIELFNLHSAFDPSIRQDDLGLDGLGWAQGLAPFLDATSGVEPDLLVLNVLAEQGPSLERWDTLLAAGHAVVATVGTDAHQNVLPGILPDGERGDSYRRMLRWLSQHIRVGPGLDADDPGVLQSALAAGHFFVVFEVLGTPAAFDLYLDTDSGRRIEMGGEGTAGTLHVDCPRLATGSPRSERVPEISVTIFKNGAEWAQGCGDFPTDGAGAYRVRADIVPHHLDRFLGADAESFMHPWPWVYSQAIRVQ